MSIREHAFPSPENLAYLETTLAQWRRDPRSVSGSLRRYFEALHDGSSETAGQLPPGGAATAPVEDAGDAGARASFLERCSLFAGFSPAELADLAGICRQTRYGAGEAVCREGAPGDELYVITAGRVAVRTGGKVLAERGPGDVVGELAVLDDQPRSADVVAITPVTLLGIHDHEFRDLLERREELSRRLLRVLAARVRGHGGSRQERVDQLVRAYRERGHAAANLDPLGLLSRTDPTLSLEYHGLGDDDLGSVFVIRLGEEVSVRPLRLIIESLRNTYCREIGVQFTHINDFEIQHWLRARMEETENRRALSLEEQRRILAKLTDAEIFETFLHRKFVGAKRFSLEGAESLVPLLDHAIEAAGHHGVAEIVIGMAHRGRLNVLANIVDKPARRIFREFEEKDPARQRGGGDVKYHLGHSTDRVTAGGESVHISLSFNPSHLEFIDPVVVGRTRAKQDRLGDRERSRAMAILVHGNAAFVGQGVVQEVLNMSELDGYRVGGTLHIVVNNQIAFTTEPDQGRSSQYVTDVARMLQAPVFHVNGEHPEAVHQVIQLAMEFRSRFHKDVVIDMYCYRRYGHNEGDDPRFTQPLLYETIREKVSIRTAYIENLLGLGGMSREEAQEIARASQARLEADLATARREDHVEDEQTAADGIWSRYAESDEAKETRVPVPRLEALLGAISRVPEGFSPYSNLRRLVEARREMAAGERPLDWSAAEALAFASLVEEGYRVRLTGQDSERGTFAHRHAVWHHVETGETYVPLENVGPGQAPFEICNSPLSETGVLGFEYGYSLDFPDALVVWEAQFGDFCNVAQVIVDQFVVSAEEKWNRLSGLCLLLPHGFDGQGPEHSSARLERFLSLAAADNIRVVNLTTPAQLFHALRRQVLDPARKPLIVMSPKSLLRHRAVLSPLDALASGRFEPVIDDATVHPGDVGRIVLCAGKLYYELAAERESHAMGDVALVRLEQYYPFPEAELAAALSRYPPAAELCWAQEEPENMGAWPFLVARVAPRLEERGRPFSCCLARAEAASPATGSAAVHALEQQALVRRALRTRRDHACD